MLRSNGKQSGEPWSQSWRRTTYYGKDFQLRVKDDSDESMEEKMEEVS